MSSDTFAAASAPRISVAMSVYDGEELETLKPALESVLSQQGPTFEVQLVMDGLKRADLRDFLEAQAAQDDRIRLIKFEQNRKLSAAMNAVVREMRGDYFVRMDADDISMPGRFAKLAAFMDENPDIDAAGSGSLEFTDEAPADGLRRAYPQDHDAIVAQFNYNNPFCHPSMIFRRRFFDLGLYPLWTLNEDTLLFLNGLAGGARYANMPDHLYAHRYDAGVARRRQNWSRALRVFADRQRVISRCRGGFKARAYAGGVLATQLFGGPIYPWLRRRILRRGG